MRRLGGYIEVMKLMPVDGRAAAAMRELAESLPRSARHEAPTDDSFSQSDPKLRRVDEVPPSASRGAAGNPSSSSTGQGPVARTQSATMCGDRNRVIDHRLRTEPSSWNTAPGSLVRQASLRSNASDAGVGAYKDNHWDARGTRQYGRTLPQVRLVPPAAPPTNVDTSAKRPAAVLTPASASKARGSDRDPNAWSSRDSLYDGQYQRPLTEQSQRRWSSAPIPPPPPAPPAQRWRWSYEWNRWVSY